MDKNYYIYCITRKNTIMPPGLTGFEGNRPFMLPHRDLQASISPVDAARFDPSLENLKCHEDVIRGMMDFGSVLPMKFSTIVKSEKCAAEVLRKYYGQFMENLERVEGKVELGVKIFCRVDTCEAKAESDSCSGRQYFLKKYEQYIEEKKRLEPYINMTDAIHERLLSISSEACRISPFRNSLIMNASYLVPREMEDTFCRYVGQIKEEYGLLKIIYSGPWPPYHFVRVKEEGEDDGRRDGK